MGSSRFPGKVMKNLGQKKLINFLYERVAKSRNIDAVVIATTTASEDDVFASFLYSKNLPVFRGSELDVLSRFYAVAIENEADIIVRLTADDPLKCWNIIDNMIYEFLNEEGRIDYLSNNLIPTFPEGLDVEIFTFDALKEAYLHANLKSEREHVTSYIYNNQNVFQCRNYANAENLSHWRLTVDYPIDLELLALLQKLEPKLIELDFLQLKNLIIEHPKVIEINSGIVRNEGYHKSREDD